jgi:hypothetical protein
MQRRWLDVTACVLRTQVQAESLRAPILALIKEMGWGKLLHGPGSSGIFKCSVSWVQKVCQSLNLTRRAGTTAAQKLPVGWEAIVLLFCQQIAYLVFLFR